MSKKTLYTVAFLFLYVFISTVSFGQAPVANFTSNVSGGCAPLVVNFQDQSTGNPTTWTWDLGNSSTSSKANPSVFYFTPGVYQIKLTVTNASGTITQTGTITVYENPAPDFVSDFQQGCAPLKVQFTDQSTAGTGNTNATWAWDFGNGTKSSDQNPVVEYNTPGTFPVVLKVTNDKGCSKVVTKTNYINATPGVQPSFTTTVPSPCAAPFPVIFTNTSTGPGHIVYTWDFGDGIVNVDSTNKSKKHTYTTNGIYPVTLIMSSDLGCSDTLRKDSAVFIPVVTTDFTIPDTICVNQSDTFFNASSINPASSVWQFSDGTTINSINAVKAFTSPGNYTVKLTNTYGNCTKDTTKSIVISPLPVPLFKPSQSAQCKPDLTVSFENQSQNGANFMWDFGDSTAVQNTITPDAVSHTFTQYGTFTVTLTAFNANGCSATYSQKITVAQPTIKFANLPTEGCLDFTLKPIAKIVSPTPISSFSWDFGDGSPTASDSLPTHVYTKQGTYNISLTITTADGCTVSDSVSNAVRLGSKPTVAFTAAPLDECANQGVTFTNQSTPPDAPVTWDFGDGTGSTAPNPFHLYTDTGYFQVKLIVNNNGCRGQSISPQQYVHIKPPIARFTLIPDCSTPYRYSLRDLSIFDPGSAGHRTWLWNLPDGSTSNAQSPPLYQFPGPGNYSITLTISNGTCTNTLQRTIVIVDKTPSIAFNTAGTCKPANILLHAVANNASEVVRYTWIIEGKTIVSGGSDNLYYFTKSGDITLHLTTTDQYGCSYSTSKVIHINGPNAAFQGKNVQGCIGLTSTFSDLSKTDSVNQLVSWTWDFGDSTARVTQTTPGPVDHIYNTAGIFSPTLIVGDASGCYDSISLKDLVKISSLKAKLDVTARVCFGFPMKYQNLSSGDFNSSVWSLGDHTPPFIMNNQSATYMYKDTGFYTVKLVITDQFGCKDSVTLDSAVQVSKPRASFSVNDSVSFCPPFDVTFTNTSTFADRAIWDFGTGAFSNQWNVGKLYTVPGSYKVILSVYSPDGSCRSDASTTIILKDTSDAKITYDPLLGCRPMLVNINGLGKYQSANFYWDFGDGNTTDTTSNEISHVYNDLGTFIPKVILTESSGCVIPVAGTDTINIKGAKAFFKIDKRVYCDSANLLIQDSTTYNEPIKYLWNFGDGTYSTDSVPSHQYTQPGIYPVYLAIQSVSGCKDTAFLSTPIKVVQSPLISITGDSIVCQNQFMVHNGVFDRQDTSQVQWAWVFPNGQYANVQNPVKQQYKDSGDFAVQAVALNSSGCADTTYKHIRVNPLPSTTLPSAITTQVGYPVQIPATYSPNVISYVWSPTSTLNCSDCPEPIASPKFNTDYTVSFTDSNGCRNTATVRVIVVCKNANVFVPNTFSPNGDGNNDVFYVRGRGLERVKSLRIFNRWGQIVFERSNFPVNDASYGWDGTFNGNKPQAGVYIYQLEVFCENSQVVHFEGNVALIQ